MAELNVKVLVLISDIEGVSIACFPTSGVHIEQCVGDPLIQWVSKKG